MTPCVPVSASFHIPPMPPPVAVLCQHLEINTLLDVVFDVIKTDSAVIIDHFVVKLSWKPHCSAVVDLDVMFSPWVE